jgi:hypothetical protein
VRSVKSSSKVYLAIAALSLLLIALAALYIGARIEPSWSARVLKYPAYPWGARWADVVTQALILLAAVAAVSHVLKRVTER